MHSYITWKYFPGVMCERFSLIFERNESEKVKCFFPTGVKCGLKCSFYAKTDSEIQWVRCKKKNHMGIVVLISKAMLFKLFCQETRYPASDLLITARVRSTREGNVLTRVCPSIHPSVCPRGGGYPYPIMLCNISQNAMRQGGYLAPPGGGYQGPGTPWGGTEVWVPPLGGYRGLGTPPGGYRGLGTPPGGGTEVWVPPRGVPRFGYPPGGGTKVWVPPPGGVPRFGYPPWGGYRGPGTPRGTKVRVTPPGGPRFGYPPGGYWGPGPPPGGGGGVLRSGYPRGGYQGLGTPPGGVLRFGYPPPRGYWGLGTPPGGYRGLGTPPGGGTRVGQQKEYSLHGGRYASCVHAGGLSCLRKLKSKQNLFLSSITHWVVWFNQ